MPGDSLADLKRLLQDLERANARTVRAYTESDRTTDVAVRRSLLEEFRRASHASSEAASALRAAADSYHETLAGKMRRMESELVGEVQRFERVEGHPDFR